MAAIESEKELEDYIFESWECGHETILGQRGFLCRQFRLKGYGILDLLFVKIGDPPNIHVTIVELKKGAIDLKAIGQISRYYVGVTRLLSKLSKNEQRFSYHIRGVLVGDSSDGNAGFTIDAIPWLSAKHYEVSLEYGLAFEDSGGWRCTDEDLSVKDNIEFARNFRPIIHASMMDKKQKTKP